MAFKMVQCGRTHLQLIAALMVHRIAFSRGIAIGQIKVWNHVHRDCHLLKRNREKWFKAIEGVSTGENNFSPAVQDNAREANCPKVASTFLTNACAHLTQAQD